MSVAYAGLANVRTFMSDVRNTDSQAIKTDDANSQLLRDTNTNSINYTDDHLDQDKRGNEGNDDDDIMWINEGDAGSSMQSLLSGFSPDRPIED